MYQMIFVYRVFSAVIDLFFLFFLFGIVWIFIAYLALHYFPLPDLDSAVILLGLCWCVTYILYIALTVSTWRRATFGMRVMGLEMHTLHAAPPGILRACFHGFLFLASLPTLLIVLSFMYSIFDRRHRMAHDVIAGVVIFHKTVFRESFE